MFQLGNRRYEGLLGFESLEFAREASYKEHELLGVKPRLQRVGDRLEEMSLTLNLHAQFCDPEEEIDALEKSRAVGEILGLYTAAGRYYGDYLLVSLRVRVGKLGPDSGIMLASVDIGLREYFYEDRAAAARRMARQVAFALDTTATPFPQVPTAGAPVGTAAAPVAPTAPNVGAKATNTAATLSRVQQIAGTVLRLGSTIREAVANPSRRAYLIQDALRQSGDLSSQAGGLVAFLNGTPSPSGATAGLLYAISGGGVTGGVGSLAATLTAQLSAADLAGAVSTSGGLLSEQERIRAASQEIATNAAVGRSIL